MMKSQMIVSQVRFVSMQHGDCNAMFILKNSTYVNNEYDNDNNQDNNDSIDVVADMMFGSMCYKIEYEHV